MPVGAGRWTATRRCDPERGESAADYSPARWTELLRTATGMPGLRPEILATGAFTMAADVATTRPVRAGLPRRRRRAPDDADGRDRHEHRDPRRPRARLAARVGGPRPRRRRAAGQLRGRARARSAGRSPPARCAMRGSRTTGCRPTSAAPTAPPSSPTTGPRPRRDISARHGPASGPRTCGCAGDGRRAQHPRPVRGPADGARRPARRRVAPGRDPLARSADRGAPRRPGSARPARHADGRLPARRRTPRCSCAPTASSRGGTTGPCADPARRAALGRRVDRAAGTRHVSRGRRLTGRDRSTGAARGGSACPSSRAGSRRGSRRCGGRARAARRPRRWSTRGRRAPAPRPRDR